jgi:hypothetical protein
MKITCQLEDSRECDRDRDREGEKERGVGDRNERLERKRREEGREKEDWGEIGKEEVGGREGSGYDVLHENLSFQVGGGEEKGGK